MEGQPVFTVSATMLSDGWMEAQILQLQYDYKVSDGGWVLKGLFVKIRLALLLSKKVT